MNTRSIYTICLFLSGFAGLVYQVVWERMFALVFGSTVYAVSTVVAGFMAGLALGSHLLGKRADGFKRPLHAYIMLEVGIAVCAIAVSGLIFLVDDYLAGAMPVESLVSGQWLAIRFIVLFVILLAPTALMGGALPVMSKFYVKSVDGVGRGVGSLYAANTYGAVAGCFLCGYMLIRMFGVWGALGTAFCLNLSSAGLAWMAFSRQPSQMAEKPKRKSAPRGKKKKPARSIGSAVVYKNMVSVEMALLLAGLSGFCALSYEVLWARAFAVSFKSTVYLFSDLLTVFLLGLATGSHLFSKRIDGARDPMRLFGLAQVGIGLLGMASVVLLYKAPGLAAGIRSSLGQMSLARDALTLLTVMAFTFFAPVFLMGLAYPLICRVITRSLDVMGRSAGMAYAVGSLGGIGGSIIAGFLLAPVFGLQNSLFVISAISIATGYLALTTANSRKALGWVFPVSAVGALCVVAGVNISGVDIGLGVSTSDKILFAEEGVYGTVKVTQTRKGGPLTLLVNDYQLATSQDVAVRFGHMPLFLKPDAKDVLLISLGSGITAGAVGRHDVDRIDCVELVPTLLDVQHFFKHDNHSITKDKRFHLTFWDGRHYVKAVKRKYDLVISDLFQPDSAGVGALYTLEHFRNVKAKLKKGGAMAQWLAMYQLSPENLKVIMRTFAQAFEHVQVWSGDINSELPTLMLLGSSEPIRISPGKLLETMDSPSAREDMIEHSDPLSFLNFFVMDRQAVLEFTKGSDVNTDNRPVVEFTAPGNIWMRGQNAIRNFIAITRSRHKIPLSVIGGGEDTELAKNMDRYFEGRSRILEGRIRDAKRDYPGALASYKAAERLVPHDPFLGLAVFDMGYIYYGRGDYRTASKLFQWVTRINDELLEAHFYLAKSYQKLGMRREAIEAFRGLAKLRPDLAGALIEQ